MYKQLAPGEPPLMERRPNGAVRFAKGHRRHGGIQKGYKRQTGQLKALAAQVAQFGAEYAQAWLAEVAKRNPGAATDLWLKALEFQLPKLARTDLHGEGAIVKVEFRRYDSSVAPQPPEARDAPAPSKDKDKE